MPAYIYDDIVRVRETAPQSLRPGERAWIVGVFTTRPGEYFNQFPPGVVYTIEFEDGSSLEVHEQFLVPDGGPEGP